VETGDDVQTRDMEAVLVVEPTASALGRELETEERCYLRQGLRHSQEAGQVH
jgi:hypothetical protein